MNRRRDADMTVLGDMMSTRKVAPKANRAIDAHDYIDELRQAQLDDHERIRMIWNHVQSLSPKPEAEDTGKFTRVIANERNARWADFGSKLFWWALGIVAVLFTGFMTWIFAMAYAGMHAGK